MTLPRPLRLALTVLVVAVHIAGVRGASTQNRGAPAATAYCCCPGECHCTADCCNHGPAQRHPQRAPIMRSGAGSPAWQASSRCGAWQGTLQRAPGHEKVLTTEPPRRAAIAPEPRWSLTPMPGVVVAAAHGPVPGSPRAPPSV